MEGTSAELACIRSLGSQHVRFNPRKTVDWAPVHRGVLSVGMAHSCRRASRTRTAQPGPAYRTSHYAHGEPNVFKHL